MSDTERRPDQAENLRTKMIDDYKEIHGNFPPRGEVHKDKVKKKKLKLKYPVISILVVFFFSVPVLIFLIYGLTENETASNESSSLNETVYIPKIQKTEEGIDSDSSDGNAVLDEEDDEGATINKTESSVEDTESEETESSNETKQEMVDQKEQETIDTDETKQEEIEIEIEKEDSEPTKTEYREIKTHTVKTGETLFKIAIMYYNSRQGEEIIRQYNGIEANNIYVGQTLKIPLK